MKLFENSPIREFFVGSENKICIKDCGKLYLEPNEMVTFSDSTGSEYDITRKEWGYYATPSINKRLINFGFKTALVRNSVGHIFVMLVKKEKLELFVEYISQEESELIGWLDDDSSQMMKNTHN